MSGSIPSHTLDVGTRKKIRALLSGCGLDDFAAAVRDFPFDACSPAQIVQEACHQLALSLYHHQYGTRLPRALMILTVAPRIAGFLPDAEKKIPLIQALWMAGGEDKSTPFLEEALSGEKNSHTVAGLAEAITARDFSKAYAAVKQLLAEPSTKIPCRDLLLTAGLWDITHLGHKFLYLAKTVEALETLPQADAGKIIFPALHYLVFGTGDSEYFSLLQMKLKQSDLNLPGFMANEGLMAEEEAKRLEHVLVYQYPGLIIENLIYELQQGVAPEDLFQVTLGAASQAIIGGFGQSWIYPVHGYNFAHECREAFRRVSSPAEKMNFLFMSAMFVNKMAVKSMDPHKAVNFAEVDLSEREVSPAGLEKAVAESRPEIAGAIAARLVDTIAYSELAASLARIASRNDSSIGAGHDLKLACHILSDYPEMRPCLRVKLIPALAYFLAEVAKDYDLYNSIV